MKQAVLSNFDLPWLPIMALIIFVVCFAIYVWWTYKKENKSFFDQAAMLPLEENTQKLFSEKGN